MKPIVIYHKGCADGIAAAWCFWKEYGDQYEYYEGSYGDKVPDILDRDVYLVDFSYKFDITRIIAQYANSVIILDHHESALNDLYPLAIESNVDMDYCTVEKSGAMIAWEYVKNTSKHNRKLPEFLKHVQDRDLWRFEIPFTKEIMAGAFSYPVDIEQFDKFMGLTKNSLKGLAKEGEIILRKFNQDLNSISKQCKRFIEIEGYEIPVANANGMFASELGNMLAKDYPFSATYYDTQNYRKFSLRSIKGKANVAKIANIFGGGGHPNAAGFNVKRDHYLAKV